MKKNTIFKLEIIDANNNTITDRFKTREPISIMEAIVKYGGDIVALDWREALLNWDKDVREVKEIVKRKKE